MKNIMELKKYFGKAIKCCICLFVLIDIISHSVSILAIQKLVPEVVLGTDGLLEKTDQNEASTLCYGSLNNEPLKWAVFQKNSIGASKITSVALTLEKSYQGEDNGENFFKQILSDDEKSIVSDLQASKQEDGEKWSFGMSLVQDKIAFTIPAIKSFQNLDKIKQTDHLELVAAVYKTDQQVDAKITSDDYYLAGNENTVNISHLSAYSVYNDATQLSAMITNQDNKVLYYGKVNDADKTLTSIQLPKDLSAGTYQISLFAQKVNGDYQTDFVSAFSQCNITLHESAKNTSCHDETCSHVYRDLDGNLYSLCANGKRMIESNGIMTLAAESDTNTDTYYNQGIYFVSIPNIYNIDPHFTQSNILGNKVIERVDAVFTNDNNDQRIYRMIELKEGVFSTVVPPKKADSEAYKYIQFRVYYRQENDMSVDTYDLTRVKYNFTVEGDKGDIITQDCILNADGTVQEYGLGEFSLKGKVRDCFYWNDSYLNSYWSGHPSSDNKTLDESAVYIDNDKDGIFNDSTHSDRENDYVWDNNDIWISFFDNKTNQFVSRKVDKQIRIKTGAYYLFDKDGGVTENSLIVISNGKLSDGGHFVDQSIENNPNLQKKFYFIYNIASGDNKIIMRNLNTVNRIFDHYTTLETSRYVAFRDQLYGETGALIAGDKEQLKDKLQYRLPNNENDISNSDWKDMVQNTGINQNADLYKLFFTPNEIPIDNKYIQFRILDSNNNVKYSTDIETINDTYAYPCFFGDVYQKQSQSYTGESGKITGYWTSIYRGNYHGDGKQTIPVESNSSYNQNYYYGSATFYDYYSDVELQGKNLAKDTFNGYNSNYSGSIFNNAISRYFKKSTEATCPLYFGSQRDETSVNGEKLVNFRQSANGNNRISYNDWKNSFIYSYGYVDKELTNGTMTTAGVAYPQFDESFLRGNNELNTALGHVYNNVSFPFKLNSDGYWEFDSTKEEYAVRMKEDNKAGYYLDLTNKGVKASKVEVGSSVYAILPFNDPAESQNDNRLNFLFGMKMELEFKITENGTIKIKKDDGSYEDQDITFSFMGDDDFIAYIDNKVALDIMGVHNPIYGEINFNSGNVTTKGVVNGDQGSLAIQENNVHEQANLYSSEAGFSKSNLSTGTHKLTMFYMERGQGSSNLRMKFNFPSSNQLDITNEVDMSSANPIFNSALQHIGSFDYTVKNQVTSGQSLDVEQSAGYLSNASSIIFNDFTDETTYSHDKYATLRKTNANETDIVGERGNVLAIENKSNIELGNETELGYADMVKEIEANRYWTTINYHDSTNPSLTTVDLSQMAYLRMEAYNASAGASGNGIALHIRFVDQNDHILQATADQVSYLAFSNELPLSEWTTIRLDLEKLKKMGSHFDMTHVKQIQFAFARGGKKLYIDDLDFRGKITETQMTGFNVNMEQISDYGSIDAGKDYTNAQLSPIKGAWYKLSSITNQDITIGNSIKSDKYGAVALGNDQKASFVDKFREGSYLQISQIDTARNSIFKTNWSILENAVYEKGKGYTSGYIDDNYLALYPGQSSVINDPNLLDNSITHVEESGDGTADIIVSDNRNVSNTSNGSVSYIYPSSNRGEDRISGNNNTMVFRSYLNADNPQKNGIHLTVAFENTLITGGIIITKNIDNPAPIDKTYKFHIHYTNIAGLNLERNSISTASDGVVQDVEVTVPKGNQTASVVIYGVPKNTTYTIHEVNEVPTDIAVGNVYQYPKTVKNFNIQSIDKDNSGLKEIIDETIKNENHLNKIKFNHSSINTTYDAIRGVMNENIQETVFTNHLETNHSEVKITKKLSETVFDTDKDFLFHLHYTKDNKNIVIPITVVVSAGTTESSVVYDNLPLDVQYQIHEVDESVLTDVSKNDKSTPLRLDTGDVDDDKQHNPKIEKNATTEDGVQYENIIKGTAKASRHGYTIVNHGPNTVSVMKTDKDDNPLTSAYFTLYKEIDGSNEDKVIDTKITSYYKRIKFNENDPNYDENNFVYVKDKKTYTAYKNKDNNNIQLYYFMPLTNDEIKQWQSGQLNDMDVVAMAFFNNLADGNYYLKETFAPNGYRSIKGQIKFTFKKNDTMSYTTTEQDENLTVSEINNEFYRDRLFSVQNEMQKGEFDFYKQNKQGEPLQAEFVLYKNVCEDSNHNHETDLVNNDLPGNCWRQVGSRITADSSGYVKFDSLNKNDTYRLVEIKTLEGYILPEGQWIVKFNPKIQGFTVTGSVNNPPAFSGLGTLENPLILKNYTKQDIPSTGGRGWLYMVGLLMMVFSLLMMLKYSKKKEKIIR